MGRYVPFNMADMSSALNGGSSSNEFVEAMKSKIEAMTRADLTAHPIDFLDGLSPAVKKRVELLEAIQDEHDELEAKFFEERAALEARYQVLYQPLYAKRFEIVNGIAEVQGAAKETPADAVVAAKETPADAEVVAMDTTADKAKAEGILTRIRNLTLFIVSILEFNSFLVTCVEKGVPSFWLVAMKNNIVLAHEITARDEEALKFLKDIKYTRNVEPKGFKLEFVFDENPFFSNSVLTKTYIMVDENEPILENVIGTEINWLDGKCLTEKKIMKKKAKVGAKNAKPITKTETVESFFNFFDPPEIPQDSLNIDQEAAGELQVKMEQDYEIGSEIRDKIIPHVVSWFTGEAAAGEFDEDDDEDDEDDGLYDEDDEEDDADDDEEDDDDDDDEEDKVGEVQQSEKPAERKQQ
ncbi:nucleosome assembly protein 1-2 [Trifolium repens]|nr:nucleosome assembly protein 1-2 [Trifolium repens]